MVGMFEDQGEKRSWREGNERHGMGGHEIRETEGEVQIMKGC